MAQLSISLLGPFQVTLDGKPLNGFETGKSRALLAYLAVEADRAHSRAFLAELLWPDRPRGKALANLRHTLASLRKTIGDAAAAPPFLRVTRRSIGLNRAAAITVDVATLVEIDGGSEVDPAARREVALQYRGPFLEGFSLDDCPDYEAWLVVVRERLTRAMMRALDALVVQCIRHDDCDSALTWTERQLRIEPWNEEVHQQQIWLLARAGRRSEALRQVDRCTAMLADEFGVTPQPATTALAASIRDEKPLPRLKPDDDRWPPGTASNTGLQGDDERLPGAFGQFLGRQQELGRIEAHLRDPACRLVTIVGVGGVGKTRLAVEAMGRNADRYRDGVRFVPLVAVERIELLANAILQALTAEAFGAEDPSQQLLHYLRDKELLLVLDNMEQLTACGPYLGLLVESAPGIDLLVTSRRRLNLSIEWLLPLAGLEAPESAGVLHAPPLLREISAVPADGPRTADDYAAVQLFVERMKHLQPDLALDATETATIGHICRLLDGLPLAIELAATWTRLLSLQEIAEQLSHGIDLLSTTEQDIPLRHRNMSAVFEHSWTLLPRPLRVKLAQLAVFRGGMTLAGAQMVAGVSIQELAALLDSSWVRRRADGRYEMHELVRQYCERRLLDGIDDGGRLNAAAVYQRHCEFYGSFMERMAQSINFDEAPMTEIDAEFGNLQASWRWAITHDRLDIALNVAVFFFFYVHMAGRYRFGIQLMQSYAVQLRAVPAETEPDSPQQQSVGIVLAWLAFIECSLLIDLGLLERASASISTVRATVNDLAPDERVDELLLIADLRQATVDFHQGKLRRSIPQYHRVIARFDAADWRTFTLLSRKLGAGFWTAGIYGHLSDVAWCLGDYESAIQHDIQNVEIRRSLGELRVRAKTETYVARLAWTLGEYKIAEELAQDALDMSQRLGDRIGVGLAYLSLGRAATAMGKSAIAHRNLVASLDIGRRSGHHFLTMQSLFCSGTLALAEGDPAEATTCAEEALAAFADLGTDHSNYVAGAWLLLGRAALAQHKEEAAERYFRKTTCARGRAAWEAMDALAGLAEIQMHRGQTARTARMLTTVMNSTATAATTRCYVDRLVEEQRLSVKVSPRAAKTRAETRHALLQLANQLLECRCRKGVNAE